MKVRRVQPEREERWGLLVIKNRKRIIQGRERADRVRGDTLHEHLVLNPDGLDRTPFVNCTYKELKGSLHRVELTSAQSTKVQIRVLLTKNEIGFGAKREW